MDVGSLAGRWVRLEPLAEGHREPLRAAADNECIWEHFIASARGPEFDLYFDNARSEQSTGARVPFVVRRLADDVLVGSTSYLDPVPRHRRVEIGSTWYVPSVWATAVNPECKLLLMAHAFEVLGLNRVQLCTDVRNTRSQAAIAKLGAVKEGILRSHMMTMSGRIRDSVLYAVTAADWPQVKARLEARLAAFALTTTGG